MFDVSKLLFTEFVCAIVALFGVVCGRRWQGGPSRADAAEGIAPLAVGQRR